MAKPVNAEQAQQFPDFLKAALDKAAEIDSKRNFQFLIGSIYQLTDYDPSTELCTIQKDDALNSQAKLNYLRPFNLDQDLNVNECLVDGKPCDTREFLLALANGLKPISANKTGFRISGSALDPKTIKNFTGKTVTFKDKTYPLKECSIIEFESL